MASEHSMYDMLKLFTIDFMQDVHTCKPAIVKARNGTKVDCTILTKTRMNSRKEVEQPDVFDVPLQIISAKRGSCFITVPVDVGDLVLVCFSDRSLGELLDSDGSTPVTSYSAITHGYDPILAIPCFFTSTSEVEVDSENIVIQNEQTSITIAPDGEVRLTGTGFHIGDDSVNIVERLAYLAQQVQDIATAVSTHTHATAGGTGTPSAPVLPTPFTTAATNAGQVVTQVDGLTL